MEGVHEDGRGEWQSEHGDVACMRCASLSDTISCLFFCTHFVLQDRDHRKIGQVQELFFFHKWSPGSAFFLPHGTRVYNKLQNLIKTEYVNRGYQEVITPNVFNVELWKTSGHYDNYKGQAHAITLIAATARK